MKIERSRGRKGAGSPVSVRSQGRAQPRGALFKTALSEAVSSREPFPTEADLEEVQKRAAALKQSPTLENLRVYREALGNFLARLLAAYSVEEIRGFNRFGKRSITILVRTVDAKLEELARLVLQGEQDTLKIAARLDDIRGLLLDYLK